jgi:hypothetical protein
MAGKWKTCCVIWQKILKRGGKNGDRERDNAELNIGQK